MNFDETLKPVGFSFKEKGDFLGSYAYDPDLDQRTRPSDWCHDGAEMSYKIDGPNGYFESFHVRKERNDCITNFRVWTKRSADLGWRREQIFLDVEKAAKYARGLVLNFLDFLQHTKKSNGN